MTTKTAIISVACLTRDSAADLSGALAAISGVEAVDFSVEREVVVIDFDPESVSVEELTRAVLLKGYKLK